MQPNLKKCVFQKTTERLLLEIFVLLLFEKSLYFVMPIKNRFSLGFDQENWSLKIR